MSLFASATQPSPPGDLWLCVPRLPVVCSFPANELRWASQPIFADQLQPVCHCTHARDANGYNVARWELMSTHSGHRRHMDPGILSFNPQSMSRIASVVSCSFTLCVDRNLLFWTQFGCVEDHVEEEGWITPLVLPIQKEKVSVGVTRSHPEPRPTALSYLHKRAVRFVDT